MTIRILVDGKELEVKKDQILLQACLENDIYIPNLCFMETLAEPPASCRLCFVEIEGIKDPVASCTVRVQDKMVVKTQTPSVRRLQKTGLRLLLSVHDVDCKNCPANKKCALQHLARFLNVGLKPKHLERRLKALTIDDSHPNLTYYPNRCVLCGKCIQECRDRNENAFPSFAKRGFDTVISFYGDEGTLFSSCDTCSACVEICPVGALILKRTPPHPDPVHPGNSR